MELWGDPQFQGCWVTHPENPVFSACCSLHLTNALGQNTAPHQLHPSSSSPLSAGSSPKV